MARRPAGGHDLTAKLMYAHLLPRGAGSAASIELGAQIMFYGGDLVELLLAMALLLDWYRRGARALAREERRHAGSGAAMSRRISHHMTPGVDSAPE